MSIGKQSGGGSTTSTSKSYQEDYGTAVNEAQAPLLQNMWLRAGDLYNQTQAAGGQPGQGAFNQGMGALNQTQSTLNRLQNPGTDPMMDVYSRQLGQNFNEQIMPSLRGDAMVAGGLGSSRAGIAQGLAAQGAQRNLQDFGAQLYGQNQDRALQAAGLGQQNAQGYQSLGAFGMGIPWYNAAQYQGLLGAPIMEDLGGYGSSSGGTSGRTRSSGFSFGL